MRRLSIMSKEQAEFLKNAIENGGEECRLHEVYSGRGMYGKTTYAISFDFGVWYMMALVVEQCRAEVTLAEDWDNVPEFGGFRQDSLGCGTVIY